MSWLQVNAAILSAALMLPTVVEAETAYQCITDPSPFAPGAGGPVMLVESTTVPGGAFVATYIHSADKKLMFKRCADISCTSSTERELIANIDTFSTDLDITIQLPGNRPIITVSDNHAPSVGIRLVLCSDEQCSAHSIREVSNTVGPQAYIHPTVAVSGGRPHVAYFNRRLELYSCSDFTCATANLSVPDGIANFGFYVSAADYGGNPLFAYTENDPASTAIRLYRCTDGSCASGVVTEIDTLPFPTLYTELGLRDNAIPVVSFSGYRPLGASYDVHYVYTCADQGCTNGQRSSPLAAPGAIVTTAIDVRDNGFPFATFTSVADSTIYYRQCRDTMCTTSTTGIVSSYAGSTSQSLTISGAGPAVILHSATNGTDIAITRCNQLPEDLFRDGFE